MPDAERTYDPDEVLNALSASIAVLDVSGVIVAVNDTWVRFARANGATDERWFVGIDYLDVCERALASHHDDALTAMLDGLRALLRGARGQVSMEYPCDSPDEQRWFHLSATPLPSGGAVVAHENITERKRIEHALVETERTLRETLAREQILARIDALTGITNRRQFFDLATHELSVALRYHQPLALILFDIDDFKRTNDTHGHTSGDELLKRIARTAREHLREADLFARYGGDEFVILLPNTSAAGASMVGERIRADVAAHDATISCGVAEILPGADTLDALIHRADMALYAAKQGGRDRISVSSA